MTEPIRPEQVAAAKAALLPDEVIEAFNQLITEAWDGHVVVVRQDRVIDEIQSREPDLTRHQIFEDHLLDVEPIYRAAGWEVEYDKPGWNESYEASFTFRKK